MSRLELQPVYVLHTRPYRDSSLLVDYFSRAEGRIGAVVRGAKRAGRGNPLQPFAPLLASWSGRTALKSSVLPERAGPALALQGVALVSGLYLNELLMRLLPADDPHPRVFDSYSDTLGQLALGESIDIALRRFELLLLDELGYGINLNTDAFNDEPLLAERFYYFESGVGLISCVASTSAGQAVFSGADLIALASNDFTPEARRSAKRLCRLLIDEQLEGRPLLSRALLR